MAPYCFAQKKIDFVIFMQFFAILLKMSPTSQTLMELETPIFALIMNAQNNDHGIHSYIVIVLLFCSFCNLISMC